MRALFLLSALSRALFLVVYPRSRASNIFKSSQAQKCRRFCTGSYKGYEGSLCPDSWDRTAHEPRLSDPPATKWSHRTGRRWRSPLGSHGKACSRRCRLLWSTMGMPGVCFVISYFEQKIPLCQVQASVILWCKDLSVYLRACECSLFSLSLFRHTHTHKFILTQAHMAHTARRFSIR